MASLAAEKEAQGEQVTYPVDSDISVFMYANEFKEFVSENVNTGGVSIFSKSVNEILDMDIVNGMLIDPDELNEEPVEESEESTNEETSGNAQNTQSVFSSQNDATGAENDETSASIADAMNLFFSDENIKSAANTDDNPELSAEEMKQFILNAASQDGNSKDVTVNDLTTTLNQTVAESKGESEDESEQGITTEKSEKSKKAKKAKKSEKSKKSKKSAGSTKSNSASGVQSSGVSYGAGSGYSVPSDFNAENAKKTLKTMTKEEINKKLTKATKSLSEKQKTLDDISAGTYGKLPELKEAVDSAYGLYQDQLKTADPTGELANKINDQKIATDNKKQEISNKKNEISDKKCEVSNAKTAYESATKSKKELKTALEEFNGKDDDKENQTKLREAYNAAVENETKYKQEWETKQKELEEAEKELKGLETEDEDSLQKLNEEMTQLEQQATAANPACESALNAYKDAQTKYDEYKESAAVKAQEAVQTAQDKVDKYQKALNNKETEETKSKYGKSNLPANLFSKEGSLAGKEAAVSSIAKKYGIEPEFLAAIMCHETGYGTSNLCRNNNNPGGTKGVGNAGTSDSGFASYKTIEDGVEAMAKNLAGYTKYEGVTSVDIDHVDAIGVKYCEGNTWAGNVKNMYAKIKSMK